MALAVGWQLQDKKHYVLSCDGSDDCGDASDEDDCSKISVLDSYQTEVPPIALSDTAGLSTILFDINITSILELDEVDSVVTAQYTIRTTWRDPQATFRNLRKETYFNTISSKDAAKIWHPKMVFYNTRNKETTGVSSNEIAITQIEILLHFYTV